MSEYTPIIQQYLNIKNNYKDFIVFFRMGDFYEFFFDDAIEVSKLLFLTLTSKGKYKGEKIPMAGFPCVSLNNNIIKLTQFGKKIAICEQIGKKKKNGLIERKVIFFSTPGTLLIENYLKEYKNNYIVCIYLFNNLYNISALDLSTGHFFTNILDNENLLFDELDRIDPAEILISKDSFLLSNIKLKYYVQIIDQKNLNYKNSLKILKTFFNSKIFPNNNFLFLEGLVIAAGTLIYYLNSLKKYTFKNVVSIEFYNSKEFLHIDSIARKDLEIFKNLENDEKNTIFKTIDYTITPMGKRLLKRWLSLPLLSRDIINNRLKIVSKLKNNNLYLKILDNLKKVCDLERILSRFENNSSKPIDLKKLQYTLEVLPNIFEIFVSINEENFANCIMPQISKFNILLNLISSSIIDNPSSNLKHGCTIIKKGFDKKLDAYRNLVEKKEHYIFKTQKKEIVRTNIHNLKIEFGERIGYYIELPIKFSNLPSDYFKIKTIKNKIRYSSKLILELEKNIQNSNNDLYLREIKIYKIVLYLVKRSVSKLQFTAQFLAKLDVLNSFAKKSSMFNWCEPILTNNSEIEILEGRHPIIENNIFGSFSPNNLNLNNDNKLLIITGANMGGKSTYMRQNAIIILLAHIGSHVPAKIAKIGVIDKILTRIGSADDLANFSSTFMLEMKEISSILSQANEKSFIIIDEIGRGTGYLEGESIAWAILLSLIKKKSFVLFSTHFYNLTKLGKFYSCVKCIYFNVIEFENKLIFFYKFYEGVCDNNFAIHVAKMAGLTNDITDNASKYLSDLKQKKNGILTEFLNDLNPDFLSPKEALEKIYFLKTLFNKKE